MRPLTFQQIRLTSPHRDWSSINHIFHSSVFHFHMLLKGLKRVCCRNCWGRWRLYISLKHSPLNSISYNFCSWTFFFPLPTWVAIGFLSSWLPLDLVAFRGVISYIPLFYDYTYDSVHIWKASNHKSPSVWATTLFSFLNNTSSGKSPSTLTSTSSFPKLKPSFFRVLVNHQRLPH